MSDRTQAEAWARKVLAQTDVVILDTETTGLYADSEIVQIAIITPAGQELLNTLVKPTRPIPLDAQRIHGITDAQLADAPTFAYLAPLLRELLSGMTVVIYNAAFDTRLVVQPMGGRLVKLPRQLPLATAAGRRSLSARRLPCLPGCHQAHGGPCGYWCREGASD